MKTTRAKLVTASAAALVMVAGAISPANAKCTKKNPLFGFEYYVADKHCPKTGAMNKVIKKKDVVEKNKGRSQNHKKTADRQCRCERNTDTAQQGWL